MSGDLLIELSLLLLLQFFEPSLFLDILLHLLVELCFFLIFFLLLNFLLMLISPCKLLDFCTVFFLFASLKYQRLSYFLGLLRVVIDQSLLNYLHLILPLVLKISCLVVDTSQPENVALLAMSLFVSSKYPILTPIRQIHAVFFCFNFAENHTSAGKNSSTY